MRHFPFYMPFRILVVGLLLLCAACGETPQEEFNSVKWTTKVGKDYPYRDLMLNDLMSHHHLHGLKKDSLVRLLGLPDRSHNGHLYYTIAQQRLVFFPLHTKTLVIKLDADSTVEWRKIHE
jgi:hypothetical protein